MAHVRFSRVHPINGRLALKPIRQSASTSARTRSTSSASTKLPLSFCDRSCRATRSSFGSPTCRVASSAWAEAPRGNSLALFAHHGPTACAPPLDAGKPITEQTRALCCREITRGLARGYYLRRFFARYASPDPKVTVSTRVRRGQGSAKETLRRENPERGSRSGFLSFRSY